ncbi:heparinase II/III family protein [Hydrogenophaga taeniospiralis]|uniref:heparinase II/III family protein n=1 Tax=Hydrogenophaga taeniospiralis TaxID=65656 RepID=UPI001CFA14CD|nr:heparinase II/III family protein [Hydrogenophaga taeniospiralis]UCU94176.1 alginate lyase family protein [Hydrogenophaga taeniospiralis]
MTTLTIARFPSLIRPWPIANQPNSLVLSRFSDRYRYVGDRFTEIDQLSKGVFATKGVSWSFGDVSHASWDDPFPSKPENLHWQHDFSFFSWSISLVASEPYNGYILISKYIEALEQAHPIRDGKFHFVWTPIAISLRILALVAASSIAERHSNFTDNRAKTTIRQHIAYCASLLEKTAERYLGYNHYVFSTTALAVAAEALGLCSTKQKYASRAVETIKKHILPDGMWEERTPTYHIHMLLLANCLQELITDDLNQYETLTSCIERMQLALSAVVHTDGEIAILNDSAINDSVLPKAVGWVPASEDLSGHLLPEAGFAKLQCKTTSVIFDAGPLGPDDVIGHGHADFLSIEVCWLGTRLLVDPGVASITNCPKRILTRSAQSHNGPTYAGLEPAEFFGAWRVGWRGTASFEPPCILRKGDFVRISGATRAYERHLKGSQITRSVDLWTDGGIRIADTWNTLDSAYQRRVSFIIPATWNISPTSDLCILAMNTNGCSVEFNFESCRLISMEQCFWYPFGPLSPQPAKLLRIEPDAKSHSSIIWIRNTELSIA